MMATNVSAVLSDSFDEVLTAVQETQRGRWFLDEYAKRAKHQDTQTILAAISRLESFVSSGATTGADTGLIEKAKAAIAQAKAQIKAENKTFSNSLTEEARLFAKLAEHARSAITGELSVSKSVDIALNLIDDLDHQFTDKSREKPSAEQTTLFKRDEDLFQAPRLIADNTAPAPAVKVEVPVAEVKPEIVSKPIRTVEPIRAGADVDTVPRGAKLTIHRSAAKPVETETVAASPEVEAPKADVLEAPGVAASTPAPVEETLVAVSKPRIVITRRKAEEMIAVPLVDQHQTPQTAA